MPQRHPIGTPLQFAGAIAEALPGIGAGGLRRGRASARAGFGADGHRRMWITSVRAVENSAPSVRLPAIFNRSPNYARTSIAHHLPGQFSD